MGSNPSTATEGQKMSLLLFEALAASGLFLLQVVCFWSVWKVLDHIFNLQVARLKNKKDNAIILKLPKLQEDFIETTDSIEFVETPLEENEEWIVAPLKEPRPKEAKYFNPATNKFHARGW